MVNVLQICEEVGGLDAHGAVVAKGVNVDEVRVKQRLVDAHSHLASRIVHRCKRGNSAADDVELSAERLLVCESEVRAREVEQRGDGLHLHLRLRGHRDEIVPVLLVLDKQILSKATGNSNDLGLLLDVECGRVGVHGGADGERLQLREHSVSLLLARDDRGGLDSLVLLGAHDASYSSIKAVVNHTRLRNLTEWALRFSYNINVAMGA